ncbi:hypothetical protein G6F55_012306 [Rhizopus delemar]|uniref:C-CAP/cofactor C-like domain-containing protein n=3 Tax=Rhizopus TaxID=4842 RepID=I1CMA1_RHIO9|nr:hypothetical protein RO3G_14292 [Rhizopus delemar RA 99-880]KAG1444488.1 hypothetical protein G6F55_012306 [Rhizopus delemar]KAG1533525.1 hypothetical protein G6F51_012566 [Rhizopus arrhizus]KAG1488034.1 hypothetical protein G6F54_012302 [Rhizopus delemar]KAG1494866.1 hypothetical protein G6F53_012490 [Rhizopus delemar]|eukprot:EIE89581.1 hypothetical protein RO3G_14292 [Rhizopus delemar RA 99-880]
MAATEAASDFWQQFKAEYSKIDDLLTTSTSLPKTDLPSHFDTILQKINNLEKRITESLTFIPSYDERQFSMQLKELSERLEKQKTELTPKAKFSFKSRNKKKASSSSTPALKQPDLKEDELIADNKEELLSEATVLLKDQSNAVLRLSEKMIEKKSIDILLSNLKQSVIILDDSDRKISAIHIKNIEDCVIFCGSIDGSVLIYGITNSILVVDCHQLRIHDARNLEILMHVTSRPIIEDSTGISTGKLSSDNNSINYYDQIEDFNWLKKQASPNWKIMDDSRLEQLHKESQSIKQLSIGYNESLSLSTILPSMK